MQGLECQVKSELSTQGRGRALESDLSCPQHQPECVMTVTIPKTMLELIGGMGGCSVPATALYQLCHELLGHPCVIPI